MSAGRITTLVALLFLGTLYHLASIKLALTWVIPVAFVVTGLTVAMEHNSKESVYKAKDDKFLAVKLMSAAIVAMVSVSVAAQIISA